MTRERTPPELYAIRKTYQREGKGVCVSCGKPMPEANPETRWPRCKECKHSPQFRGAKARARKKVQQRERAEKPPKWRERERKKNPARQKRKRARWRAAGLCTHCGKRPPAAGKSECDPCREAKRIRSARRRERDRAGTVQMRCVFCEVGTLTWDKSKERIIVSVPQQHSDHYIPRQSRIDYRDMTHSEPVCAEFRKRCDS